MTTSAHFTPSVGVAPGTSTVSLDGFGSCGDQGWKNGCPPTLGPNPVTYVPATYTKTHCPSSEERKALMQEIKYYMPYASPSDYRGNSDGLGVINETDWWRTGRPYGLPGTAALFFPGTEPNPEGVGVPIRVPSYMSGRVYPPGLGQDTHTLTISPIWKTLMLASAAVSGFHGYRRNKSIGWGIGWFLLGGAFPIITPTIAVAQGFGKRKRRK